MRWLTLQSLFKKNAERNQNNRVPQLSFITFRMYAKGKSFSFSAKEPNEAKVKLERIKCSAGR